MKKMKRIILTSAVLVLLALSSCSKKGDVLSAPSEPSFCYNCVVTTTYTGSAPSTYSSTQCGPWQQIQNFINGLSGTYITENGFTMVRSVSCTRQ